MDWRVTFLPDGKSADVADGTSLVDASIAASVRLIAPCNGKGTCGKCGVQFHEGAPEPIEADARFRTPEDLDAGWRLACMHRVCNSMVVFAAPATLGKVDFGPSLEGIVLRPNVRKVYVRLDAIRGDLLTWGDLATHALGGLPEAPTLGAVRALAAITFAEGMELTVVVRGGKAELVEPGDTRLENYGLALDIGTTTVGAMLVDLNTGEEAARTSALNRQSVHGSDVMSRLTSLQEHPDLLPVLQRLAMETVGEVLDRMLESSGVRRDRIYEATIAGNSAMHHIVLGLDPSSLAVAPYDARVTSPLELRAGEVGLPLASDVTVYALPNVASFIGGDALGAVLAVGLHRSEAVRCLVDIGTNGEIVLASKGRIIACSTPAGPAFEGGSISCGMIASEGAIHTVRFRDTVEVETIGGVRPRGITGSGLIQICAELRRVGLLSPQGKYVDPARLVGLTPDIAARLRDGKFLVARSLGREIALTQRDVRELQLAKGVIFAGIETLRIEMGLDHEAIDALYLAGTFGSYLDIASARTIALVPPLPRDRIRAVGNAALVGAVMCLLSLDARAEAERLARRIEHIELPLRKDFQDIFMDSMLFPPI